MKNHIKTQFYQQCEVERGNYVIIAWIPEQYAKEGKIIKLRDDDGKWSDGWMVRRTYPVFTVSRYVNLIHGQHEAIKRKLKK